MNPIARMLIEMGRFYDQALDNRQVEMYVDVLSQFDTAEVLEAGKIYVRDPRNKRFPIPPHLIMAGVIPTVDDDAVARDTAAKICGAVPKFGYMQGQAARAYIGEAGWKAVNRLGGWGVLCEQMRDAQVTTYQAQLRDSVKSILTLSRAGQLDEPAVLPAKLESSDKKVMELVNSTLTKQEEDKL